jgi:hypothetical protein
LAAVALIEAGMLFRQWFRLQKMCTITSLLMRYILIQDNGKPCGTLLECRIECLPEKEHAKWMDD